MTIGRNDTVGRRGSVYARRGAIGQTSNLLQNLFTRLGPSAIGKRCGRGHCYRFVDGP